MSLFTPLATQASSTVERPAHVHVKRRARVFVTLQKPQGGEVEDSVGAVERALQNVRLENIAADVANPDAPVAQRAVEVGLPAAHEIVIDQDLPDIGLDQLVHGMRADQAGAADDDDFLVVEMHVRVGLRRGGSPGAGRKKGGCIRGRSGRGKRASRARVASRRPGAPARAVLHQDALQSARPGAGADPHPSQFGSPCARWQATPSLNAGTSLAQRSTALGQRG